MSPRPIRLAFAGTHACAWLRAVTGADEEVVRHNDTATALQLLDRLLVARPDATVQPGEAGRLTIADRDQLLAAIWSETFGPSVEAVATCASCGAPFDVDFRLDELARRAREEATPCPPDGEYELAEGARFRLPMGEDELAVLELEPEEAADALYARCLLAGDAGAVREAVLAAMEQAGPTLDLDLDAACPECETTQKVPFSAQKWLLDALGRARRELPRQVHRLARAYGWSLEPILELSREQRLRFVDLVDEERRARARLHAPFPASTADIT